MGPAFGDELIWIEAVGLYSDGMHADDVCRRYGITRSTLAQWCDWVDFRSTWVDPGRRPPVPSPAPDFWPDDADGANEIDGLDAPVFPPIR
ncbi:helix-turn-helix domain-containing protein [Dietzia aerolata]|uniref:Helix-turn-helix domain-containing protein n=1 Tax=Dietzia aerolata TaxID=595984 RepID=A0ABV5JQ41_9ACTN|nr:helix-turn-helix domain-containing protein [Dietzia aerolata]MBB0969652.1 helix-turn-helix domain-containing protein [Dietzia aerolata]